MIGFREVSVFTMALYLRGFMVSSEEAPGKFLWTATHTGLPGNYFLAEIKNDTMILESKIGETYAPTIMENFGGIDSVLLAVRIVDNYLEQAGDTK